MSYPQVTFQVRQKSRASLSEMGERVGAALGCVFEPTTSSLFAFGEALEASCLGLQITLSHDPEVPEGELRTYVLMGTLRGDIEAEWDLVAPRISISEYILGVMSIVDGTGWYIADRREKLEEAGLDPEDEAATDEP